MAVEKADEPQTRRQGPPDILYKITNPIVKTILRSPLHGLLSGMLMLITFRGRKTGKEYTIPVGYQRRGDTLIVFSHHDWWKNLRGGKPVSVLLKREKRSATARPIEDRDEVMQYVQDFIDKHGIEQARRIGVTYEGEGDPTPEELRAAVEGTVVIRVELDGAE